MKATAQLIFNELDSKRTRPIYLIEGEEPFQANEIWNRFKKAFTTDASNAEFQVESWDGEGLDAPRLLESLNTLSGLFDAPGSKRLIELHHGEKVSTYGWELLGNYLKDPSPDTCFVIFMLKFDRRKPWAKLIETHGLAVSIIEPYAKDWPRWKSYFESITGKTIEAEAWQTLLDQSQRKLSLVAQEMERVSLWAHEKPTITLKDVRMVSPYNEDADPFQWAHDIGSKQKLAGLLKYFRMNSAGENDIKLLAILVRHLRQLQECREILASGEKNPKLIAAKVGVPPFFINRILDQATQWTDPELRVAIQRLSRCDHQLKVGYGSLFENFMMG